MSAPDFREQLNAYLRDLHLPAIRSAFEEKARRAEKETLSYERYLFELVELECQQRREHRITRLLQSSKLPLEKTLENFQLQRLPQKVARQIKALEDGTFLDRRENVLVFGNPGSGKTHLLSALGQELIRAGRRVAFTTCSRLVQDLLLAKKELRLTRTIRKLAWYEALVIDDLGYVQQDREEMEVLFTLLAERYERGSVLISSNLPFSKWEAIFKDPMTTAAAIDRLVHHSVILELNIPSYRMEQAKKKKAEGE
ncbi:MAG: IS21-like element helper ATPase IstB [Acidobacteriota bacterium]|nr:IS21-like element helper ATPase IstB [Acidobacteriota bacterium]